MNSSFDRSPDGKDEWLTPPEIVRALGIFDLDPCSPVNRPWDTAKKHYTIIDDGLKQPWFGRVWLNPPYGDQTPIWMDLMAAHNHGTALIFARTETGTFFDHIWGKASGIFFFKGRLRFYNVDGTPAVNKKDGKPSCAGAPSCLIAYGPEDAEILATCELRGYFIKLEPKGKTNEKDIVPRTLDLPSLFDDNTRL